MLLDLAIAALQAAGSDLLQAGVHRAYEGGTQLIEAGVHKAW